MKDLLSKEHYSYKIPTLIINSSAYVPSIDTPQYGLHPILLENLDFSKIQTPDKYVEGGGSTVKTRIVN